jgi:hypothetical protein
MVTAYLCKRSAAFQPDNRFGASTLELSWVDAPSRTVFVSGDLPPWQDGVDPVDTRACSDAKRTAIARHHLERVARGFVYGGDGHAGQDAAGGIGHRVGRRAN